ALRVAAGADVLEVRAAAEDAAVAFEDHRTHFRVAREREAGPAEVARHLAVHRVEAVAPLHRQRADRAFLFDADEGHLSRSAASFRPRPRRAGVSRIRYRR